MSSIRLRIKKAPQIQKDRGAGCKNASVTPVTGYDRGKDQQGVTNIAIKSNNNGREKIT